MLNLAVDAVEAQLATGPAVSVDVAELAARTGTTEHHLRRMFASLAGMPPSECVRRRRMPLAAAELVSTREDLLTTAARFGYGSTEAFGLNDTEPTGVLSVSDDLDPDRTEVASGTWAAFRTDGPHPAALQDAWAATATWWCCRSSLTRKLTSAENYGSQLVIGAVRRTMSLRS